MKYNEVKDQRRLFKIKNSKAIDKIAKELEK